MKWIRWALGFIAWWFASLAFACENKLPGQSYRLQADSALFAQLDSIASHTTVERARCLYGWTKPDTVILLSAAEPQVEVATATVMNVRPCPIGAIAFWHVHLAEEVSINGQIHPSAQPPESFCYLSRPDMESALSADGPPLQFVAVGHGIFCFWTRAQIEQAAKTAILPALPGQMVHR